MKRYAKFKSFYNLPKEKNLLDYIYGKVSVTKNIVENKIILQLFELYRTSQGFDPALLSKLRFKRMKAADYLELLNKLEKEIPYILESKEYQKLSEQPSSAYSELLKQFVQLQVKMESNDPGDIEKQINDLKKKLIGKKEYELLLSLNKLCRNFYSQHLMDSRIPEVMNEYQLVLDLISRNIIEFPKGDSAKEVTYRSL